MAGENAREFFAPSSIAVVGASDRSEWSHNLATNLIQHSPSVRYFFVNPNRDHVHGHPAFASLADLPQVPDLVYVMVGRDRVVDALLASAKKGVKGAIILTSGFAEVAGGETSQGVVRQIGAEYGMEILGPNASGYINAADGVVAYSMSLAEPPLRGSAAFVLHSGGLINPLLAASNAWGMGYSIVASTGNEAGLDTARIITHLVTHEPTRAIGIFLETVRDAEAFQHAANAALEAGKPIVALTVGSSEAARRAAMAHTGALTPDAKVMSAVLDQLGIVRVDSLEELIVTTALLAQPGRRAFGPTLGVVSASGGACDIIADTAHRLAIPLADFSDATRLQLSAVMPDVGIVNNPLDLTGIVADVPDLPERALGIVAADANTGVVVHQAFGQPTDAEPDPMGATASFAALVRSLGATPCPSVLMDATAAPLSVRARSVLVETGSVLLPGIELGLRAIGHAMDYDRSRTRRSRWLGPIEPEGLELEELCDEAESLAWLTRHGVAPAAHRLATTATQASAIALEYGREVAVKVVSPGIPHKSRIGGVRLDVPPADVASAFDAVVTAARTVSPAVDITGVIVAPMHEPGFELIVGVRRDPLWGWVLAVGTGGVHVESLADVAIRALPVTNADIVTMLTSLRGWTARPGACGSLDRTETDATVTVIQRICEAVVADGAGIQWLEVNPLRVVAGGCVALDALMCGSRQLIGNALGESR